MVRGEQTNPSLRIALTPGEEFQGRFCFERCSSLGQRCCCRTGLSKNLFAAIYKRATKLKSRHLLALPHLTPIATSLKLIVWGTCRKSPFFPCLSLAAPAALDKEITWITQPNATHSTILRTPPPGNSRKRHNAPVLTT